MRGGRLRRALHGALRSGRVHADGVITHRFALDNFAGALAAVRSDPSCLKAVVEL